MRVISKRRIKEAQAEHPSAASALDGWYRIMEKNKFEHFGALRETFNTVDKVGDKYVFNIAGNRLRLIASIHFDRQRVYIREILTHKEYDKGQWK